MLSAGSVAYGEAGACETAVTVKRKNGNLDFDAARLMRSTWPHIRRIIKGALNEMPLSRLHGGRILSLADAPAGRMRPSIVVGVGRILGLPDERLLPFAAITEMIHNATLIHDDIQDGSESRRGVPSLWKRHSVGTAVLLGDSAFLAAYRILESLDLDTEQKLALFGLVNRKAARLLDGQLQDHERGNRSGSPAAYERIAAAKTGSLFGLAFSGTLLLAGAHRKMNPDDDEAFDRHFGTIYQLRDDLHDLFGEKAGRRPGDDLLNGGVTVFNYLPRACGISSAVVEKLTALCARYRREESRQWRVEMETILRSSNILRYLEEYRAMHRRRLLELSVFRDHRPEGRALRGFFEGCIDSLWTFPAAGKRFHDT